MTSMRRQVARQRRPRKVSQAEACTCVSYVQHSMAPWQHSTWRRPLTEVARPPQQPHLLPQPFDRHEDGGLSWAPRELAQLHLGKRPRAERGYTVELVGLQVVALRRLPTALCLVSSGVATPSSQHEGRRLRLGILLVLGHLIGHADHSSLDRCCKGGVSGCWCVAVPC